jgi:hypothetical protein
MTKTLLLGAALAFGLATAANAGITPAPVGKTDPLVTRVAEGCGPGFWRGPNGRCHPCTTAGRARPATTWARSASAAGPTSKGRSTRRPDFWSGRFHFALGLRPLYELPHWLQRFRNRRAAWRFVSVETIQSRTTP